MGDRGEDHHNQLRRHVLNALNGDPIAKAHVTTWVSQTRTRFEALLALGDVEKIYYMEGAGGSRTYTTPTPTHTIEVADGWGKQLLEQGSLTAVSGEPLNTGTGQWTLASDARIALRSDHNDHVHVKLNRAIVK